MRHQNSKETWESAPGLGVGGSFQKRRAENRLDRESREGVRRGGGAVHMIVLDGGDWCVRRPPGSEVAHDLWWPRFPFSKRAPHTQPLPRRFSAEDMKEGLNEEKPIRISCHFERSEKS